MAIMEKLGCKISPEDTKKHTNAHIFIKQHIACICSQMVAAKACEIAAYVLLSGFTENCIEKFIVRDFENAFVAFWPISYSWLEYWYLNEFCFCSLRCHIKNYVHVVAPSIIQPALATI